MGLDYPIRKSIFHKFLNILNYTEREKMLWDAVRFVKSNRVKGEYWEFGVYKGDSFIMAHEFIKRENWPMHMMAFDSFKGLPEPNEKGCFFKGQYASPLDLFEKRCKQAKVHNAWAVEGWFDDVLGTALQEEYLLGNRKIAIVNIDCDLYESAVVVLRFIAPFLQEGSIIMFDDWFAYSKKPVAGERRAFQEWMHRLDCESYKVYGWHGKAFIFHKEG